MPRMRSYAEIIERTQSSPPPAYPYLILSPPLPYLPNLTYSFQFVYKAQQEHLKNSEKVLVNDLISEQSIYYKKNNDRNKIK